MAYSGHYRVFCGLNLTELMTKYVIPLIREFELYSGDHNLLAGLVLAS